MNSDPIDIIRSDYENPIIEEQNCPFLELRLLSVFEDEDAADDPLIPDLWFITTDKQVFKDNIPLEKLKYYPKTSEEALTAAKWLIEIESFIAKYETIKIIEENLPLTCIMEIKATIYLDHPMLNSKDKKTINFIIKIKDGIWEIKSER